MNRQGAALIVLIPGFAADETDTSCLPSQQLLIKAWNKLFPQLNIIILAFQYPFTVIEYKWYGNRVIPFNGQNKRKIRRLMIWQKVWRQLKKITERYEVKGIFSCWCGECALIGKYFSDKYGLNHFIWICGQDATANNKLVSLIRPHPDSLIAISDFLVGEFSRNHHIKPAHVIPIGIDPSEYASRSAKKDIDILGAGSLTPLKQYEIFVEIIYKLKNKIPHIKAMICGDGPDANQLKKMIDEKGLAENLFLTGKKPHGEVLELMLRSKILLHPSSYEGFGAVCLEALYAGAHVISFVKPMNREIQNWHIVGNAEDMYHKAASILSERLAGFTPVMLNDVEWSSQSIMKLFDNVKSVQIETQPE